MLKHMYTPSSWLMGKRSRSPSPNPPCSRCGRHTYKKTAYLLTGEIAWNNALYKGEHIRDKFPYKIWSDTPKKNIQSIYDYMRKHSSFDNANKFIKISTAKYNCICRILKEIVDDRKNYYGKIKILDEITKLYKNNNVSILSLEEITGKLRSGPKYELLRPFAKKIGGKVSVKYNDVITLLVRCRWKHLELIRREKQRIVYKKWLYTCIEATKQHVKYSTEKMLKTRVEELNYIILSNPTWRRLMLRIRIQLLARKELRNRVSIWALNERKRAQEILNTCDCGFTET